MEPLRVVAIASLALLTVTACNTSSSGASTAPSTAGGASSASVSTPSTPSNGGSFGPASGSPAPSVGGNTMIPASPGSGPAVPASQINASAMPGGAPRQVWTQDNGRIVAMTAEQGGCEQVSAEATSQTLTEVDINVITTTTRTPGRMCPMIVREVVVAAQLNAPLGNRTVVLRPVSVHR